ncbi:thioredoxin-dependent thiol peroxidase [Bacillus cytotoxicus]|uniref:thioredoxin-dependent peroxiredoxin n=1 Tax=Bacillus cytotoxicus TaxID=580165 RepID=A0AAX2CE34_9BACI|nr:MULTISPECIES: thioredoxin-dependent thiol peroxidase [Bacillus cereus group]MDH2879591.1 thioredoxin-dependent thiol peroxidase [Bacillus cytotoxicus]QTR71602.1 thioredoxin-dependent thiol peroxidase [Bacillus cytotoxicus]QTR80478.1 thioredoxin-dependent thiol peroxidase [Bacillus cytotoxicus]QTR83509.1 thioredoxin-dependent thiol peroxidase [Bacillus cytotoxicus]QTR87245.1 thioredoxin-dependent thiol peroxidase [Bacillus cytotoxicus]
MITVGEMAPDFTLEASNGEQIKLSDFRGKHVVLYFYPKDMTPGCTTEACDFRDAYGVFQENDTVILGVSPDPANRHVKFIEKYELPFLLLVDEDHKVAEQYGVWKLKKNFGKEYMGIERSTFLINKNGELVQEWRKVRVKGHVEEVLESIKKQA